MGEGGGGGGNVFSFVFRWVFFFNKYSEICAKRGL